MTLACNDLGLGCRAYLGGSRLRIQDKYKLERWLYDDIRWYKLERWLYEVKKGCRDKYLILFSPGGLQGNWVASEVRAGCRLFFVRDYVVHVGVPTFFMQSQGF